MRGRVLVGVVVLLIAAVYFFLAPAFMISSGNETILWGNILLGAVLVVVGVVLLFTGLRHKK